MRKSKHMKSFFSQIYYASIVVIIGALTLSALDIIKQAYSRVHVLQRQQVVLTTYDMASQEHQHTLRKLVRLQDNIYKFEDELTIWDLHNMEHRPATQSSQDLYKIE